jgi:transposase-like protein
MGKGSIEKREPSRATYEALEELVRFKVQEFIQDILEEEVSVFLGRGKSERLEGIDKPAGYRNGYGRPRRLSLMNGTIAVRHPRVRDTEKRFESAVLPLFVRRTKEVRDILPELYLHGLAKGDFELAMRGLLGAGAPLSASSIERLKAKWQCEYEEWQRRDLSGLELLYQWADGIYSGSGERQGRAPRYYWRTF